MRNLKQEKLINAILYFVQNTKNCYKMKLFKLLFYLDFIHIKQYGTDVTGLNYYTLPMGPVPLDLMDSFSETKENDFKDFFTVTPLQDEENPDYKWYKILPKKGVKPNLKLFTPRELEILDNLAFMYKDTTAKQMSDITHLKNSPWDKTKDEKGMNQLISYELAHDKESTLDLEFVMERFKIDREINKYY